MSAKHSPAPRGAYRHGDLRRALIAAGLELARSGGPAAVTLREATRRAGVAPNAAYRHFASRDELLQAVRSAGLAALATAIERELAGLSPDLPAADLARASLRAVGAAYLAFAQTETGLFRTAFTGPDPGRPGADPARAGASGLNPFELLGLALDRLVEAKVLPAERRKSAEYLAWSAVHGFAALLVDGPLHGLPAEDAQHVTERLLAMVEKGL